MDPIVEMGVVCMQGVLVFIGKRIVKGAANTNTHDFFVAAAVQQSGNRIRDLTCKLLLGKVFRNWEFLPGKNPAVDSMRQYKGHGGVQRKYRWRKGVIC